MTQNNPINVLLIMTDQQRGDCLGCDGHPVLETPVLDALAEQGTRFSHAYSAVPACIPARASLISGMDQWHTGIMAMGAYGPIPHRFKHTLAGEFAQAGYHTQGVGKMHFNPQRTLNGFHNIALDESSRKTDENFVSDYRAWLLAQDDPCRTLVDPHYGWQWNSWVTRPGIVPEHLHPTHWTAQQAIEWLDRRDPTRPFMLKVSFARPHSPFDPPQSYYDLYKDRPMPEPAVGDWASIFDNERANTDAWNSRRKPHEIQRARAAYYGNISFIDDQIGRLLGHLKKRHGQALRDTLIIFCSDHGDMLGDHHLWRKTYGFEGSARIPMIVTPPQSWTDAPRGQVCDQVVELRDVMPTMLHGAGQNVPDTCQGQSMIPMVMGQEPEQWRARLLGEYTRGYAPEAASHFLTDGKVKYIWFHHTGMELLFDLVADPKETRNLATVPQQAELLNTWRQHMVDELTARQQEAPDYPLVRDGKLVTVTRDVKISSPHLGRFGLTAAATS